MKTILATAAAVLVLGVATTASATHRGVVAGAATGAVAGAGGGRPCRRGGRRRRRRGDGS